MNDEINETLAEKNNSMLINKKNVDLDKAKENILDFYRKYVTSKIAKEINKQICVYHGISVNSEQGKIFYNTITTFFFLACDELENYLTENINILKEKLESLSDEDYKKALGYLSITITNHMSEYSTEKIDMLCNELNQNVNNEVKERINKYLFDVVTIKMINNLKDKVMYAIAVINNNDRENNEVMKRINEKTIKKV